MSTVVPLRRMAYQYVYDHRIADCAGCPLVGRRDRTICLSQRPDEFNGLMLVGEGPGLQEAQLKVPFVGRSGSLLDKLLSMVGIERRHCYVSNAELCLPEHGTKDDQVEAAIPKCRPRLLAEIEMLQPRVIVALGAGALSALTGRFVAKTARVPLFKDSAGKPLNCPQCNGEMTLAWWKCAQCKSEQLLPPGWDAWCGQQVSARAAGLSDFVCAGLVSDRALNEDRIEGGGTMAPAWSHRYDTVTIEKRKKRCPTCAGRKTQQVELQLWKTQHKLMASAGALYRGRHAPDYAKMDEFARVDLPCAYVIPTYHPAFLLRQPDGKEKKTAAGQFMINASLAHLRKAQRLLTEDAKWEYQYIVLPDHMECGLEAELARTGQEYQAPLVKTEAYKASLEFLERYLFGDETPPLFTSVDIETDSKDPWTVTEIRCIGLHKGRPTVDWTQREAAVVLNTIGMKRGDPLLETVVRWLQDERFKKCFQNGIYDTQVIQSVWGVA